MVWLMALGKVLGGEERVKAMLAGQGVSLILKSANVNFRRPVTFPDTVRFPCDIRLMTSNITMSSF
jgi:acyl-CoA thioesterase FadM